MGTSLAKRFCASLVLFCLVLADSASADLLEKVKERGKLIVGIRNDFAPFGYLDADGQLKGYEIDLVHAVAEDLLGSADAVELVPVVAANRIEFLNAGRVDVLFSVLGVNEERAKVVDFTTHYYNIAALVLLAPNEMQVSKWEDLKDVKICGTQGNMMNKPLTEKFGAEMVLFHGPADMYQALQANRCDAIAYDEPPLRQKLREDGWRNKYKIVLDTLAYVPLAGGVRKGEPEFLNAVNEAIAKAAASGVLLSAEEDYEMGHSDFVKDLTESSKSAVNN